MQLPLDQLIKILLREYRKYFPLIVVTFSIISITVIIIGYNWPKTFSSSTTIYADKKDIIRPFVVQGLDKSTPVINQKDAGEVIFSRQIMKEILREGGWLDANPSPLEQEFIARKIKANTDISRVGASILKITYTDTDPLRTFLVTSKYAELFLAEAVASRQRQSQETYDFIDSQVKEYHRKLRDAEEKLKQFRVENVDARPGGEGGVFSHIDSLRRNLESNALALKEALIRKRSIEKQLSSEAVNSKGVATVQLYQKKITELQEQLDLLRLTYHDTYPDITRLKQQIDEMKQAIVKENEKAGQSEAGQTEVPVSYIDNMARQQNENNFTPLYQELRKQLSETMTEIDLYQTRMNELERLIGEARERAGMIGESNAAEAELVRDYEVNKDIYQNLLRKREDARVSMQLDSEGRGITYKIQELANMPLVPTGIRFLHFLILGPLVGGLLPLGAVFALVYLDPRIRSEAALTEKLELPILVSVPAMAVEESASSLFGTTRYRSLIIVSLTLTLVVYGVLIWAKLSGFEFGFNPLCINSMNGCLTQ